MLGNRKEHYELNLAFVSENQFTGKLSPNITNRRTDIEWILALGTTHFHWKQVQENPNVLKEFDAVIFVIPKTRPDMIGVIDKVKGITKRIFMQEGPMTYWYDYPTQVQIEYFKLLQDVDAVFCHNEFDKKYFREITKKPVFILPTFINTAFVQNIPIAKPEEKQEGTVFVSGNACEWYGGVSSALVTRDISEIKMVGFPSMGRMIPNEDILMGMITNKEVKYIPFVDWAKFTSILSCFKYAVHLMPTIAAGSLQLQCAIAGVACIGNKDLDTQQICFPDLAVDVNDIGKAKELLKRLINDKDFYDMVVQKAKNNVIQFNSTLCSIDVRKNILEVIQNGTSE